MTLLTLLYPWELDVDDTTPDLNLTGLVVVNAPPHAGLLQVLDPQAAGIAVVQPSLTGISVPLVTAQAILQVAALAGGEADLQGDDLVAAVVRVLTASGLTQVVVAARADIRVEPRLTATVRSD